MPDPVPQEGPPMGRTDPNAQSGINARLGPLPIWLWVVSGGGMILIFWYIRSHSSASSATTTVSGSDQSGGATPGSAPLDTLQLANLLQAMQNLATGNGATSVSPAPPAPSQSTTGDPPSVILEREVLNTSHTAADSTNGGQQVSVSHLPDFDPLIHSITQKVVQIKPGLPASGTLQKLQQTQSIATGAPSGSPPKGSFQDFTNWLLQVATTGNIRNPKYS